MAGGKVKLPRQATNSWLDETLQKEKIITKKGSKISEKGNERYEDELPVIHLIGTVFLTV